jgi:hypothetical protein
MTPRHAAALALVGWYQMVPNIVWDKNWFLLGPAGCCEGWRQVGSYDTAAECNAAKENLGLIPSEATADNAKRDPAGFKLAAKTAKEWALCVAPDDPRLREK